MDRYFFIQGSYFLFLEIITSRYFQNSILHLFDFKKFKSSGIPFFPVVFLFICLILSPEKIGTSIPYVATQLCTIYGGNLYLGLDSDMKKKSKEPKL